MTLWLFHIALFAQYGGVDGSFDPENPANPEPLGVRYGLHVVAQPEGAGSTNLSYSNEILAGSKTHLYAYPNTGYEFKEWICDGQVISTEQNFLFVMPAKDATVTAVFVFNPTNPGNPGANDWDEESRTLIVDDFETGRLAYAIDQATGGHTGKVQTLIVSGRIDDSDLGSLAAFTSMEVIDLSRCHGATTVPAWYFNGNTRLQEFSLPASITTIEDHAFANCVGLTALNCYATVPPALGSDAFQNITNNLVVYVPAESVSIYENAAGWKNLNIQPLGTKVRSLEVDLPEGSDDGRFKNLFIELRSQNGQILRYVITDAVAYTFNNLRPETVWNAYVVNADGQILGTIEGIEIADKDQRVQFESLLEFQTIHAQVQKPDGTDVTSQVQLTWFGTNGSFLGQGASLSGILPLEGTTLTLRIALSEELIADYQVPEDYVYAVQASDNEILYTLQPLEKITLKGVVVEEGTDKGIEGAAVTVGQSLYGRYTKSFRATTDANGAYVIPAAYDAPTTITVAATDHSTQTASFDALTVEGGVASLDTVALKNLKSETYVRIQVSFFYKSCAETQPTEYADSLNVSYVIWNITQGMKQITQFSASGREIVLLEETNPADKLVVTAISKTNAFAPLPVGCEVDENYRSSAYFVVFEPGQIRATYVSTDATAVTGILYDANGKFVRSGEFDSESSIQFTDLNDGAYTLVAMSSNTLFNSIFDLSKFADYGLVKGTDYVATSVEVHPGFVTSATFAYVPYFDSSKLDYMDERSSFSVNKTLVTVGNTLTLTASIAFREMYVKDITDVELLVNLPDACELVKGSVMVGNQVSDYTFADQVLTIPVSNVGERIRFCIKSFTGGDYAPSASARFLYQGKQVTKPIGQASFTVENLSISVPATVNSELVPVSGSAPARAQVWIYDDNELIGMTMAMSNGSWSVTCELDAPENPSVHHIYAKVTSDGKEMLSETKAVRYEKEVPVLDKVEMLNTAHPATSLNLKQYKTVFEFTKTQKRISPYWYWPEYPEFTFLIYFTKAKPYDDLSEVELFVYTSNRKYRILTPTRYDDRKGAYVVTSRFYLDALPVSVNVRKKGDPVPAPHKPYVEYVLDPSGYVYEGVPTNRLQGVTATIYYRPFIENRPVDDNDPGTVWNAEEYGQENPILTDEFGMYAWDVPEGEWKVKFEKAGYEPTESAWLPVPPPQLNVNIPMKQSTAPSVKSAKAYKDGVEIEFDKYMLAESLTTDNILITCADEVVAGTIELLNAEGRDENDENQQRYASRVKFNFPKSGLPSEDIHLLVNTNVKSYAELKPIAPYAQDLKVELQVKEIVADSVAVVEYDGQKELTIGAHLSNGAGAAGKYLQVNAISTEVTRIEGSLEDGSAKLQLDEDGQATFKITGLLPGTTAIQYTIVDADGFSVLAEGKTIVNVTEKPIQTEAPIASRVTGTAVYRGTLVSLTSQSDGAKIYYTTAAGDDPSTLYSAPIAINDDKVTIKAYAKADGFDKSKDVTFKYTILQNEMNLNLAEGWTWMSHNFADNLQLSDFPESVVEIKGQTKGVIRDDTVGWFGNLTELTPLEGYKMKVADGFNQHIKADAFNASKGAISLAAGWNWIGYPVDQEMTVAEALTYFQASVGDVIVGLSGSADYSKDGWKGELANLVPGQSYLLKTANAADLRFNTSKASKAAVRAHGRLDINNTPWSVDIHAYPNVMPMRLQIFRDSVLTDDEFTIAAFSGTECRGIGKYVDGVFFMNVHGDGTEHITFVAMHNQKEYFVNMKESIAFTEEVVGSFSAPLAMHLGPEGNSVKDLYSQLAVWPTVATTDFTVSLGEKTIDRLTLTTLDGKTTYAASPAASQTKVNVTNLPAGVYVVCAKSGNDYFYKKIMKVN